MQPETGTRWQARGAWSAGITLFALETAQSVLLLPVLLRWMPAADVTLWISLTAGLGLVNAAASAYALPLVRAVAGRGAQAAAPHNWRTLCRREDRFGAALLLALQALFAAVLAWQVPAFAWQGAAAVLVFFAAMHLRLTALNRFVWLNGMGQIGRDKQILLKASAVTLTAALVLAAATGSVLGLALASALGAVALRWWAGQATRGFGHNPQGQPATSPARREMVGLLLLNLSGYLNLGTDVLVANQLLPTKQAVSYAFWSRALMSTCLLAGLYTQIRFPAWAQADAAVLRTELHAAVSLPLLLPPLALLAYGALSLTDLGATLCLLPWWMFTVMAATAGLACAVVVSGQVSTSRGAYAFLFPSAAVACTAPALALAGAAWVQPLAFVFGYAAANALLAAINLWHARQTLARPGLA